MLGFILSALLLWAVHAIPSNQRRDPNIFEWTALGDYYASGVGSTTYLDGRRCLRHDQAYPMQLNSSQDLYSGDHVMHDTFCSGASSADIKEWQLLDNETSGKPDWTYGRRPAFGNPKMATLTAGGDDIDFRGIIFNCILEWNLPFGIGPKKRTCDEQRAYTWSLLKDKKLVNGLDDLIKAIVTKGRSGTAGKDFKLYVTGYPEFFNDVDTACDNVTFARDANPKPDGKDYGKMTTDLRKDANAMSRSLNDAVQQAVSLNKDNGVKFIDIQKDKDGTDLLKGHRFCEAGVKEPDQGNTQNYFWHYPYAEAKEDEPAIKLLADAYTKTTNGMTKDDINRKWPNQNDLINAVFASLTEEVLSNAFPDSGADSASFWGSVGYRARVFHPQVTFHSLIRDKVLDAWHTDRLSSAVISALFGPAPASTPGPTTTTTPPPPKPTTTAALEIYLRVDPGSGSTWTFWQLKPEESPELSGSPSAGSFKAPDDVQVDKPVFPQGLLSLPTIFETPHSSYNGTANAPGALLFPGLERSVQCKALDRSMAETNPPNLVYHYRVAGCYWEF